MGSGLAFATSSTAGTGKLRLPDRGTYVIWFYAKRGKHLRCELREMVNGVQFDLVITDADGSERVEHFEDSASLMRRSAQLEAQWIQEGWEGPFGREY